MKKKPDFAFSKPKSRTPNAAICYSLGIERGEFPRNVENPTSPDNHGLCDALFMMTLHFGDSLGRQGHLCSQNHFGFNGKTNEPMTDNELFQCLMFLGRYLIAPKSQLSLMKKQALATLFKEQQFKPDYIDEESQKKMMEDIEVALSDMSGQTTIEQPAIPRGDQDV